MSRKSDTHSVLIKSSLHQILEADPPLELHFDDSEGDYRVLLVLAQGKSIDAGDFFRFAIQSGVHVDELHDMKRQSPEALDGRYLRAVQLFKKGRSTEGFRELLAAGCIHELKGQSRIEAHADAIIESEASGVTTIAANFTHRENTAVSDAVRSRMKAAGQLTDERKLTTYSTLGWSDAQKKEVAKIKPGMVLELTRGKRKGNALKVVSSGINSVHAMNDTGQLIKFTAANFKTFDVCEARPLQVAIGDKLLVRSGSGKLTNQQRLTVEGWDEHGNPIADGHAVTHRNLCHAYASTARSVQGSTRIFFLARSVF